MDAQGRVGRNNESEDRAHQVGLVPPAVLLEGLDEQPRHRVTVHLAGANRFLFVLQVLRRRRLGALGACARALVVGDDGRRLEWRVATGGNVG